MLHWENSLAAFNALSNENGSVIGHFERDVLPLLLRSPGRGKVGSFRWLDVGPGDGCKTWMMLDVLRSHQQKLGNTVAFLLEPHEHWRRKLENAPLAGSPDVRIIGEHFGPFVQRTPPENFDLVTLVHMLYERSLAIEVLDALVSMDRTGPMPRVYMVMEDPGSAPAIMRRALEQQGLCVPCSQAGFIRTELADRSIPFREFEIGGQWCRIGQDDPCTKEDHWLFPFLLGCSLGEYTRLPQEQKLRIRRTVCDHITRLSTDRLSINDIAFLAGIQ